MLENTETEIVPYDQRQDVIKLKGEVERIQHYAETRVVETDEHRKLATDDLAMMKQLDKALDGYRREYTDPLNVEIKTINAYFKEITTPLSEADRLTRTKVNAFIADQLKKVQSEQPLQKSRGLAGTSSIRMVPKYEITDPSKVPDEFWIIDEAAIGKQVRAGRKEIAGVRIWEEPDITVRTSK